MHRKLTFFLSLSVAVLGVSACTSGNYEFEYLYEGLPFQMEKVSRPVIPSRTACLTDYGAVADGITLNTEAFATAIEELSAQGGGHLTVPAGIWRTGPITLLSGIDLHLEDNAIILFDSDRNLYPVIDINFEGLDVRRCLSPINATGQKNISITGSGIIDGNGEEWRELKKNNASPKVWKQQIKKGGVYNDVGWYPDEGYMKARATAGSFNLASPEFSEEEIISFLRPVMVSIRECENVLLEGVTFQNSPCWNLHPLYSKNIIMKGITVRNPSYATNGDGLDLDACENTILVDSKFDVGDDAICIKSGKDEDGRAHGIPCKNLIVDNCIVYSGHGGFVVGSEMSGGVENMKVSNCSFMGTDIGLRFKSTRGRGGVVKNIWCDHIYMKNIIANAIIFNLHYAGTSATETPNGVSEEGTPAWVADETTPEFTGMHFSDIVCNGAASAIFINGLPEMPVSDMTFKDITISATKGIEVNEARDISFENVSIITPDGSEPAITNSENITVK